MLNGITKAGQCLQEEQQHQQHQQYLVDVAAFIIDVAAVLFY
jgi:hypothetical protein